MAAPPAPINPRVPAPRSGKKLVVRPEANRRAKPPVTTGKLTETLLLTEAQSEIRFTTRSCISYFLLTAGTIVFTNSEDCSGSTATEAIVRVQLQLPVRSSDWTRSSPLVLNLTLGVETEKSDSIGGTEETTQIVSSVWDNPSVSS